MGENRAGKGNPEYPVRMRRGALVMLAGGGGGGGAARA